MYAFPGTKSLSCMRPEAWSDQVAHVFTVLDLLLDMPLVNMRSVLALIFMSSNVMVMKHQPHMIFICLPTFPQPTSKKLNSISILFYFESETGNKSQSFIWGSKQQVGKTKHPSFRPESGVGEVSGGLAMSQVLLLFLRRLFCWWF